MKVGLWLASLALMAGAAHAQETFGSWTVVPLDADSYFAASVNDSGGLLGKSCSRQGCRWIMTTNTNCESGSSYSALMSSGLGAVPVNLICQPNEKTSGRYLIQEFEIMDKAVAGSQQVGFAVALKSGEFRVARFSTTGWSQAADKLINLMTNVIRRPGEVNL